MSVSDRVSDRISITPELIREFCAAHELPETYADDAQRFLLPLLDRIRHWHKQQSPLVLGIQGAQGTGKTTLAAFLEHCGTSALNWRIAVLSLDDYYFDRATRLALAEKVHPLLATRGVPGTHNARRLLSDLQALKQLREESCTVPRFNKATDEPKPRDNWAVFSGPLDLIILEGWCVGSAAQANSLLLTPVNELERTEDPDGTWRGYVNEQLRTTYADAFAQIDRLIVLKAPDLASVRQWRYQQELQLMKNNVGATRIMRDEAEIARFVAHFERLTVHNLTQGNDRVDVSLSLDNEQRIVAAG